MAPDAAVLEAGDAPADDEWIDPAIQEAEDHAAARAEIDPCPVCGSEQHLGPEGPHWPANNCWKCGKRPGTAFPAHVPLTAGFGMSKAEADRQLAELRKGIVADILDALKAGASPEEIAVGLPAQVPDGG